MFYQKRLNCPEHKKMVKKLLFCNSFTEKENDGKGCFFANVNCADGCLTSKYGFEQAFSALHEVSAFCPADDKFLYASNGKLYCHNSNGTEILYAQSGFTNKTQFLSFVACNKTLVAIAGANALYLFGNGGLAQVLSRSVISMCIAGERLFALDKDGRLNYTCCFSESAFTTPLARVSGTPSSQVFAQSADNAGYINFADKPQKITSLGNKVYVACEHSVYCVSPDAEGIGFECKVIFSGRLKPLTLGRINGKICFVSGDALVVAEAHGSVKKVLKNATRVVQNAQYALQTDDYVLVSDVHFDGILGKKSGGRFAVIVHDDFSVESVLADNYLLSGGSTLCASDGTTPFFLTDSATADSFWVAKYVFSQPVTLHAVDASAERPFNFAVYCDGNYVDFTEKCGSFPVKLTGKNIYIVLHGKLSVNSVALTFYRGEGGELC